MMQQQPLTSQERIAMEVKDDLKLSEELNSQVERRIRRTINKIKEFCNRNDFPIELEDVAVQIVEDMLKADGLVKTDQEVSSISRGDTSISYRDKTKNQAATIDFMKNYESDLIKYKKMKLPRITP